MEVVLIGSPDREIFSRDPITHSNLPLAPSALPGPHAWQCLAFGEPDEPRQLQKKQTFYQTDQIC